MQYAENWVLFRCVLTTWIYTVHEQVHPVVFTLVSLIAGLPIGFDRICFFYLPFCFSNFLPIIFASYCTHFAFYHTHFGSHIIM